MACGQEARSVTPGRSVCERHPHYTPSNTYMKGDRESEREKYREKEREGDVEGERYVREREEERQTDVVKGAGG